MAFAGNFMPENDLNLQDCLTCETAKGGVTREVFNKIVEAGKKAYAAEAKNNNEKLVINALWFNSTVNANCCRGCKTNEVTVNMYGGLARRSEVTPEGFALVLSHELNHAYGGTPYYPDSDRMSAEGQADYAGAKEAYYRLAKLVPELRKDIDAGSFIKEKCATNPNRIDCEHALLAGLSLGELLSVLSNEKKPQYETPDPTIVKETLTSYPDTVQCRVDTYLAGALNKERPACWFNSDEAPTSKW
jgi:hypothetical protein